MKVNDFVSIPRGTCRLGMGAALAGRLSLEYTEHIEADGLRIVSFDAFEVQRFPVSNREYVRFVAASGATAPPLWDDERGLPRAEDLDSPVVAITWTEALSYAEWIGATLPTADEWEYCLRGRNLGDRTQQGVLETDISIENDGAKEWNSPFDVQNMLGPIDEWTQTKRNEWIVVKGCPTEMKVSHPGRHFLLNPEDRWLITGFRCARNEGRLAGG